MRTWLVTGGAGFIGSNFILRQRHAKAARIINLDNLTYAGNLNNLAELQQDADHIFKLGDIADWELLQSLSEHFRPQAVVHFAAESHVDRSIQSPERFIETNVVGTFHLLDEVRQYWQGLPKHDKKNFRFLHISTDEVYGSLGRGEPAFTETTSYKPNSPYSASAFIDNGCSSIMATFLRTILFYLIYRKFRSRTGSLILVRISVDIVSGLFI